MITHKVQGWLQRTLHPETFLKGRYRAFKTILQADTVAHDAMAAMQELVYSRQNLRQTELLNTYERLRNSVNDTKRP